MVRMLGKRRKFLKSLWWDSRGQSMTKHLTLEKYCPGSLWYSHPAWNCLAHPGVKKTLFSRTLSLRATPWWTAALTLTGGALSSIFFSTGSSRKKVLRRSMKSWDSSTGQLETCIATTVLNSLPVASSLALARTCSVRFWALAQIC